MTDRGTARGPRVQQVRVLELRQDVDALATIRRAAVAAEAARLLGDQTKSVGLVTSNQMFVSLAHPVRKTRA